MFKIKDSSKFGSQIDAVAGQNLSWASDVFSQGKRNMDVMDPLDSSGALHFTRRSKK
jgi:hypothetical protein